MAAIDSQSDEKELARARLRALAAEYREKGDPIGCFDAFYRQAAGDPRKIPWADLEPNRFFKSWAERVGLKGGGRKALVVGCGLGDDARYLWDLGFEVTAFDVSSTAIEWAKKLHHDAKIQFETADLFKRPHAWLRAFDFVLEIYTIQPMPMHLRSEAIDSIAAFVAPGGRLVVVCRGRDNDEEVEQMPWPLSRKDLSEFENQGLREISFDDFLDDEETRRFVVEYQRPAE